MITGAIIFLSLMWGMGFGDGIRAYEETKVTVIRKVGGK